MTAPLKQEPKDGEYKKPERKNCTLCNGTGFMKSLEVGSYEYNSVPCWGCEHRG